MIVLEQLSPDLPKGLLVVRDKRDKERKNKKKNKKKKKKKKKR